MNISPELKAFYVAYAEWLDNGAPVDNEYNFDRAYGLCTNLIRWSKYTGVDYYDYLYEQDTLFESYDMDFVYPFNGDKVSLYRCDRENKTAYLNPERIKWVRYHAS